MDFYKNLKYFENFLHKKLENTHYHSFFQESIHYSIFSGGKRLRPLLYIALWLDLGQKKEVIFPFAVATECIHSYALVHDDLPCMDNDDYRRGKLSTHKKFGEANALLAGNALLTEAYAIMFEHQHDFSQKLVWQAISTITQHAKKMLNGQFLDINAAKLIKEQEKYQYLQEMEQQKTAFLFQSCLEVPAILTQSSEKKLLQEIGFLLGICYQIKDDILDKDSEREQIENQNTTYYSLLGEVKTRKILTKKKKQIEKLQKKLSFSTPNLNKVIEFMLKI